MREAAAMDDAGDWTAQYQYAYVNDKDWSVKYTDPINKVPAYKRLAIVGVGTSIKEEGKCLFQGGYLQSDWDGSAWGPAYWSGFGAGKIITSCDNAKKYQP